MKLFVSYILNVVTVFFIVKNRAYPVECTKSPHYILVVIFSALCTLYILYVYDLFHTLP
jgi:hypothetical protein